MSKAISLLWTISIMLFCAMVVIVQSNPFSTKMSGIIIFIIAALALSAMLLQTLKNKNVDRLSVKTDTDPLIREKAKQFDFKRKIVFIFVAFVCDVGFLVSRLIG